MSKVLILTAALVGLGVLGHFVQPTEPKHSKPAVVSATRDAHALAQSGYFTRVGFAELHTVAIASPDFLRADRATQEAIAVELFKAARVAAGATFVSIHYPGGKVWGAVDKYEGLRRN